MKIQRRAFIGLAGAAMLARPAHAVDKIIGGTLGGQAPLWPFYIAAHKGFFAAQDIDVEIEFAQSGAAVTQQLTGGAFEVALSVGITDPIHAIDKGAALALVRIVGDKAPYVVISKPEIKTFAELKGKTISVGQANDVSSVYFERMASAFGLKRGDYEELSAGVAAARYAALRAGVVDAALVLPPINFQAAAAGYTVLGNVADYVKDLPFTGMAVRRDWAQAHTAAVKRLLASIDNSIAWLADGTHRAEAIDLLVQVAHAKPDDAQASYDFLKRIHYFAPSSQIPRAELQNLIDAERSLGNVSASLTVERLIMPGVTMMTG